MGNSKKNGPFYNPNGKPEKDKGLKVVFAINCCFQTGVRRIRILDRTWGRRDLLVWFFSNLLALFSAVLQLKEDLSDRLWLRLLLWNICVFFPLQVTHAEYLPVCFDGEKLWSRHNLKKNTTVPTYVFKPNVYLLRTKTLSKMHVWTLQTTFGQEICMPKQYSRHFLH